MLQAGAANIQILRITVALISFFLSYRSVRLLEDHDSTATAFSIFVVATLLLVLASWRLPSGESVSPAKPDRVSSGAYGRWGQTIFWFILLIAALGVGVTFRVYELGSKPYGIWFDEAQNGIVARSILKGAHPVFIGGLSQLPALFFYVFAAAIKILGYNVTSLRAVTTVAGILTVFSTYLLAKELFDKTVAVLAAFFLAFMRWHVNFSRFAMHGIFAPLFMVLTFYFLVRGLKGKGPWNFVASGLMAGIGLQGYYSFILVPLVAGVFVLHHLVFERVLPWKKLATGLVLVAVTTVIIYAPVGNWAVHHWKQFNERAGTVTITKGRTTSQALDVAFQSTKKHLLMFNSAGDRNGRHNIPGAPMLDTYTGFLFILGVGFSISRLNRSSYFLLLAWAAITLQSGIWSVDFEAPQAYRTVAITPAIAMLAALPLAQLWRMASAPPARATPDGPSRRSLLSKYARPAMLTLAACLTLYLLVLAGRTNFHDYFDVQLDRADAWAAYSVDATIVAKEIKRLGPDKDYRIASTIQGHPTLRFVNPDLRPERIKNFDWSLDLPASLSDGTVYMLDISKEPFQALLHQLYPAAEFHEYVPPKVKEPVVVYEAVIPRDQVAALQGLTATYTSASGLNVQTRDTSLDFDWGNAPPVPLPVSVEWNGVLRVTEYRNYVLKLELPGRARIFLDGSLVAEGAAPVTYASKLYKGEHILSVQATIDGSGPVRFSWDDRVIPREAYLSYPLQGHGLIASFYSNDLWQGVPRLVRLEPFIGYRVHAELDEVGRPFTATWNGFIDIPMAGDYTFEFQAFEAGEVSISGQVVPSEFGRSRAVRLERGRQPIVVRLENRRGSAVAMLFWKIPSAPERRELIPTDRFTPR